MKAASNTRGAVGGRVTQPRGVLNHTEEIEGIRGRVDGLTFERTRWSTFRETNVDDLVAGAVRHELQVYIFDDPKLRREGMQMAMLRKDVLDDMVTVLSGLLSGQIAVAAKFQQVTKLVGVLHSISKESADPGNIQKLAEVACIQAQELSTIFVSPERLRPAEEYTALDDREEG